MATIREVTVEKGPEGNFKSVQLVFGPHYFLDLFEENGQVTLILGATHHGFRADASQVGGELDQFIYEIRERHPDSVTD